MTQAALFAVSGKTRHMRAQNSRSVIQQFMGLVNYYRDMYKRRAHLMTPLTRLTSKKARFKWGDEEQKAFDAIKRAVGRETLLAYPDFNKTFDIHTDASDLQLGAVISQQGKPIAFYSRKLTETQTGYSTTDKELLSIVETLKEFCNILLGHKIRIYTDHKNLTQKNLNTDRVLRWRLLIEEYSPEIIYIKGQNNVAADAMSRLPAAISNLPARQPMNLLQGPEQLSRKTVSDQFGLKSLTKGTFPLRYSILDKYQQEDQKLLENLKRGVYTAKTFRGGGKEFLLICKNEKIVVPTVLRKYVLNWYHTYLLHPGQDRTEAAIKQHLYWPGLQTDVRSHVTRCDTCQRCKKNRTKYGLMPMKEAEGVPWDHLCVDLIGLYTIRQTKGSELTLKAVTMIDPFTGWFEITQYANKTAGEIANIVEQTWLSRYPWPTNMTFNCGSKFIGN